MRSNSNPAPVLTARVLHLHSSAPSLCLHPFQPHWAKPVPLHIPSCTGRESSVEWLLCLFYLSIHPSLTPLLSFSLLSSLSLFLLVEKFSSPSIILAHKMWGGGQEGYLFRAGYTAMGALTRINAIHATHLLARSYEKGWPQQPLWKTQQRTIIHQAAECGRVAEFGFIPLSLKPLAFARTMLGMTVFLVKFMIFSMKRWSSTVTFFIWSSRVLCLEV